MLSKEMSHKETALFLLK